MSKLNLSHIAASLINDKWLLASPVHNNLCKMVDKLLEGPLPPTYGEEKEFDFKADASDSGDNMTAIIAINGIMMKGASPADEEALGLVNIDFISAALDQALWDASVKDIILLFNSPGGSTVGIEELGRKVKSADAIKPVFAWTETTCASAAYWIASQARVIGMTPSATIGNVGVYSLIEDNSKQLEANGINIQAISSGKYKLMGHPFNPLSEEEKHILQADVNKQHQKFKDAIQASRPIADENLEGLSYEGDDALKFSFADIVVDDFSAFLTTTNNIGTENNMKSYTKQAKASPVTEKVAEKVAKSAEKEMPGVPGVKEGEKKMEDTAPEAEPHTTTHKVSCPACKHEFSFSVPEHEYPKTYQEEEGAEKMENEDVDNTDKKMEEKDIVPEKDKEKPYPKDYEEEEEGEKKMEDEVKPEDKKDEPEEKKDKKAVLTDLAGWRQAFGQAPAAKNAFAEAATEFVKNFNIKK